MAKRANGEGTIVQLKDGRWQGRISARDINGKVKRRAVYGKSQADVVQKLEDLRNQKRLNEHAVVSTDSLAAWLEKWLVLVQVEKSKNTHREYELAVRRYINPYIGHLKLTRLTGEDLQDWQLQLCRDDFSSNMRLRSIRVLRNALNKAVKLNRLPFNPCVALDKPQVERREVTPLELEQCRVLFDGCESHRLGDAIILAAMTGMRKGEIFGLEWSAVNLSESVLSVRQSLEEVEGKLELKAPKTKKSRRVVQLDPIAVEALRRRLKKAEAEGFSPSEVPLVFCDTKGGFVRQSNFDRRCWHPIRDAAGISDCRFHDLRHTQASLMLHASVDMKVIQERLGHASYATTANLYSHLMQDAQANAVEKLAGIFETAESQLASTVGIKKSADAI